MTGSMYVYAILPCGTPLPSSLSGLNGQPLMTVPYRQLLAATSSVDPAGLQPTAEAVLTHEAVVETLRQFGSLLPVRFGTILPDTEAVTAALSRRYDTLLADLARLGDKVEFGLTVLWAEPASGRDRRESPEIAAPEGAAGRGDAEAPGTRYLRARVIEQRRDALLRENAEALADVLDAELGRYALDHRRTIHPTPRIAMRAAYLLHPSNVADFHQAFEGARSSHPAARFLLSGPWPPYSFVSASGADGKTPAGSEWRGIRMEELE